MKIKWRKRIHNITIKMVKKGRKKRRWWWRRRRRRRREFTP